MELGNLKGTEKQVNWAKAIRKDRLKVWQGTDPDSLQDVESMLTRQVASSWWITNRDKTLKEVCSQLQGGSKPQAPSQKPTPSVAKVVSRKLADEEVWETVVTASGFTRSGPTRDMVTGAVVDDATLPF